MGFHDLDESKAYEYIGKTVLIGVTYVDHKGREYGRCQWLGTITSFSNSDGIQVKLKDSDEYCCLPPSSQGIRRAAPGICRLNSTGEEVQDPAYLATWIVQDPHPIRKAYLWAKRLINHRIGACHQ